KIPYARCRSRSAKFMSGHYTFDGRSLPEALSLLALLQIRLRLGPFLHVNHGERFSIRQRDRDGFHGDIALGTEKLCSAQRCAHFEASKSGGFCRILASLEDHATDSLARPVRMDKKRPNLCRIVMRVRKSIFASCPVIAAVERLALAPAAATDDHQSGLRVYCFGTMRCASFNLRHKIRSVGDKLAIDAKNRFEGTFDLRLRVVLSLQSADGRFDQFTQNGHIFGNSEPEVNPGLTHHSKATLCGILSWSVAER